MAKATFYQKGGAIDYTNSGSITIEANSVVSLATRVGIAGSDIAAGATGAVHVEGVFALPKKAALALTLGAVAYWSAADSVVTATTTDIEIGWVTEAAAADDETVKIKLRG